MSICTWFEFAQTSDCAAWAQAWGGWAQAAGAMLAIWITYKLASAAHVADEKRRRQEAHDRELRNYGALYMFAKEITASIREMQRGCSIQQEPVIQLGRRRLAEALDWGRTISPTELQPPAAEALIMLRAAAGEAIDDQTTGVNISCQHRASSLEVIAKRIHEGMAKCTKEDGNRFNLTSSP